MGTIRVGQKNPKVYQSTGFTTVTASQTKAAPKVLSEDEKKKLIDSIMQMPTDKRVAALRSAGLSKEADEYETYLADEHLRELNEENRAKRLAEIKAMPEEDQLSLLIEEGFEDEAKELSEKLALDGEGERTDEGNGEENQANETNVGGEPAELSEGEDTENTEKATKTKAAPKKTAKKTK